MSGERPTYNVLFLCTGNSARSLMAEAYLNSIPGSAFKAYSAGSFPTGAPNPFALSTLTMAKIPTVDLRSKSWDEFSGDDAPQMNFIFTVCDNAAGETCPIWPGHPVSAHWPFPDPAVFQGSETETDAYFLAVFRQIQKRIDVLISLPLSDLDDLSLKSELKRIGETPPAELQSQNR